MRRSAGLLLVLFLIPAVVATPTAPIDGEKECDPATIGDACRLRQQGGLAVVCEGQCDVIASGVVAVVDSFPAKQISVRLDVARVGSATGGCTGLGLGETACDLSMRFPFLVPPNVCSKVTLTTTYSRAPFSAVSLTKAFDVCRGEGDAHTVTPL